MKTLERVLLGCALGDSLGLPFEGLSRRKASRLLKPELKQSLFFGRGMLSDDTEHSVFVIRSFEKADSPEEFSKQLRSHLRKWLLTIPPGIGFGTLKSILKMWFCFKKSSVKSAGNGPLMRTAVLAVLLKDNPEKLTEYVKVNTKVTHDDERAFESSLLYARLVQKVMDKNTLSIADLEASLFELKNEEFLSAVKTLTEAFNSEKTPDEYIKEIGLENGVTGYCIHTLLAAVYANLYFKNDFNKIIHWSISCGGDTDSVAAVAGALAAASDKCELPKSLIQKISDWPFSISYMESISAQSNKLKFPFVKMCLRNLFFVPLILVLALVRVFR